VPALWFGLHRILRSTLNPDWPLVALALWDVVPVLLSSVGFVVLSRLSGDSDRGAGLLGWVATALIAGGGLSKNILKSMQAVTGGAFESAVLENALFWLVAPGFLVAMAAFARAVRSDAGLAPRWPWATVWSFSCGGRAFGRTVRQECSSS
jgi:hypothetical protein